MSGVVLDTSAVVALLQAEPEAPRLLDALQAADTRRISAATGLNLGDCFSYALAVALDQPLLFVGRDFAGTDVRVP